MYSCPPNFRIQVEDNYVHSAVGVPNLDIIAVTLSCDANVRIFKLSGDGKSPALVFKNQDGNIRSLVHISGDILCSVGSKDQLRMWSALNGNIFGSFQYEGEFKHLERLSATQVAMVVEKEGDSQVLILKHSSGCNITKEKLLVHQRRTNVQAMAACGEVLVTADESRLVRLYDYSLGRFMGSFDLPEKPMHAAVSDRFMVFSDEDGFLYLRDRTQKWSGEFKIDLKSNNPDGCCNGRLQIRDLTFINHQLLMVTSWGKIMFVALPSGKVHGQMKPILGSPYIGGATVLGDGRICVSGFKSCAIFKPPREVQVDLKRFAVRLSAEVGAPPRGAQRGSAKVIDVPIQSTSTSRPQTSRNNEVAEALRKNPSETPRLFRGPNAGKATPVATRSSPAVNPQHGNELAKANRKKVLPSPNPRTLRIPSVSRASSIVPPNRSLHHQRDNKLAEAQPKNPVSSPTHRPIPHRNERNSTAIPPAASLQPETRRTTAEGSTRSTPTVHNGYLKGQRDNEIAKSQRKIATSSAHNLKRIVTVRSGTQSSPKGPNQYIKSDRDNKVNEAIRENPFPSPSPRPSRNITEGNLSAIAPNVRILPEKRGPAAEGGSALKRPRKAVPSKEKTPVQSSTTESSGMDLIDQTDYLAPLQNRVTTTGSGTLNRTELERTASPRRQASEKTGLEELRKEIVKIKEGRKSQIGMMMLDLDARKAELNATLEARKATDLNMKVELDVLKAANIKIRAEMESRKAADIKMKAEQVTAKEEHELMKSELQARKSEDRKRKTELHERKTEQEKLRSELDARKVEGDKMKMELSRLKTEEEKLKALVDGQKKESEELKKIVERQGRDIQLLKDVITSKIVER